MQNSKLQRFLNYTKSSYILKCFYTSKSYTADTQQKTFHHFYQLFSPPLTISMSSGKHQSRHFLGCHAADMSFLFNFY